MANLNYQQELLIGNQVVTIERNEDLIDSMWNTFKTVMVWLGGIAILSWLVWLGYHWGSSGCYTCYKNQASQVVSASTTSTKTEGVASVSGLDRLALAVEKLAEAKPSTTTANATSTAESITKVATSLPTVVVKVPDHLKLEMTGLIPPPQSQVIPISVPVPAVVPQLPFDPTANMTSAERCDYQIVVQRKARCH